MNECRETDNLNYRESKKHKYPYGLKTTLKTPPSSDIDIAIYGHFLRTPTLDYVYWDFEEEKGLSLMKAYLIGEARRIEREKIVRYGE